MKVGWLTDQAGYIGGAELTQQEFRDAAPEHVEIIDCPAGGVVPGLDRYVVNNVVQYRPEDLGEVVRPIWFHHDLSPWIRPDVRKILDDAEHIFCSPPQRDRYGIDGKCIPPYLDRKRYAPTRQIKRHRTGICSIGAWRSPSKGGMALSEWAQANGPVDVYGPSDFAPQGPGINYCGEIAPREVATTLHHYGTFVFLPFAFEPFGRCVVEAWAAGCKVITNQNIGAAYWIENEPNAMQTAREDFWGYVCA